MTGRYCNGQAATVPAATRAGHPWWDEEDQIVADPSMTAREAALHLHRTLREVQDRRRHLNRKDPA